MLLVKSVICL